MISPAEFIPLAEQTGLIVQIGRWVLTESCRKAALWQHLTGRPLNVNVNVSTRQFAHPGLVDDVRTALYRSGLPAASLTLEITESSLAAEPDVMLDQLSALKALGVRLAIDDFGTGYSALGYLHRYPVDELKIDKSFVDRLTADDPDALTLTSAIVAMSRALRLRTVAEGIETDHQRGQLAALGCDLGQGFHLSRPSTNTHWKPCSCPPDPPTTQRPTTQRPTTQRPTIRTATPATDPSDRGRSRSWALRCPSRWGQSVRDVPPGVPLLGRLDRRRFAGEEPRCPGEPLRRRIVELDADPAG